MTGEIDYTALLARDEDHLYRTLSNPDEWPQPLVPEPQLLIGDKWVTELRGLTTITNATVAQARKLSRKIHGDGQVAGSVLGRSANNEFS